MSLSRELDYLEGSLREVDLSFLQRAASGAQKGRYLRVSEFIHGAASRGWRVRLKALREHPDYQLLLNITTPSRPSPRAPLSELIKLKSGLTQRPRSKAYLELPWYKITQFGVEAHLMYVRGEAEGQLKITAREEHGALRPHDILVLSKGGQLGVYMRPHTSPIDAPQGSGELTHTSFIKLSAEHLDPRLIHPAYLAAYLTSASGLRQLEELQSRKAKTIKSALDWSLSIADLSELEVPICSPFRQAVMISAWALRVELQRQQRRYLEERAKVEAQGVSSMLPPATSPPAMSDSAPLESTSGSSSSGSYDEHLSDLIQPFDGEGPLRALPLHEAPLFPTLGRFMSLRSLTRHLMSVASHGSNESWRALNIMTLGHLSLLKAQRATEPLDPTLERSIQRSLNQQCVGLCSAALTQLNRHLLVQDHTLNLPRHKPEPWFYFTTPSEEVNTDLAFVFWGHGPKEAPSLGRALSDCDPLVRSSRLGTSLQLSAVLQVSISKHFAQTNFYAHTLGGYLDFKEWSVYLFIYRKTKQSSQPLEPPAELYLSSLDRLCHRAHPPLVPLSHEQLWRPPLKELIRSVSPKYSFHLEHLSELHNQLKALTAQPQ